MRVNLNQLSVFYLAARHGSMTEAAKRLYVSTPAVTMQIKKLEGWLGFPVFNRVQGGLSLTTPGRELYDILDPLFKGLDEMERQVLDLVEAEEIEIRLGTHHLPANYFIPDLIAHVNESYPRFKVKIELGTQDALLEKLWQQKLDLVLLIGDVPEGAKCSVARLFSEELALVTASDSRFGKLESISIKDIGNIPLILQQKGTGALRAVLDYLAAHKVEPQVMLENLSSDVIKQFLLKMHAAAFISRFIVQRELDEGVFHEINVQEGPGFCHFYLAYIDNQYTPAKVKNFLSEIRGFTPSFHSKKA